MGRKKAIPAEDVTKIIQEELEPVAKKSEDLKDGYENLLKEHVLREAEAAKLTEEQKAKIEELEASLAEAKAKLEEMTATIDTLKGEKEEAEAKASEAQATAEATAEEIPAAVEEAVKEAREAFIHEASAKLEKHINEVTSAAFNSSRTLFEADFAPIESNILQELGRTLAPYISDPELPTKVENLMQTLNETKEAKEALKKEAVETIKKLDESNQQLKKKLAEVVSKYNSTKLQEYKNALISKLPERSRETARQRLAEVNQIPDIKRIYLAVIRESASSMSKTPGTKPVAARGGKTLTEAAEPKVETPEVSDKQFDSDVIPFDDEMKRRSGVL